MYCGSGEKTQGPGGSSSEILGEGNGWQRWDTGYIKASTVYSGLESKILYQN